MPVASRLAFYTILNPVLKVGLTNSIDLEVQFNGYNSLSEHNPTNGRNLLSAGGAGDLVLRPKFNVFGNEGGPALAVIPYVKFPIASHQMEIRFRGNIRVTDAEGESKQAAEWIGKGGRARKLRDARVTAQGRQVGAVVCVHAKGMKEPWCLAASDPEATAAVLVNHYAKRWTIEPAFRDTKDLRFGMGLSATRIGEPTKRDRLLLVSAFAMALLTLLGSVGESLGMDRLLKSNTSKTRVHSLFRQGCMLYELIPNMPEHRLAPLMTAFAKAISQTSAFSRLLAHPV